MLVPQAFSILRQALARSCYITSHLLYFPYTCPISNTTPIFNCIRFLLQYTDSYFSLHIIKDNYRSCQL